MANEVQRFEHPEHGTVRALYRDGSPWFYAEDIAKALGYVVCDTAMKHVFPGDDDLYFVGYDDSVLIINEDGVWSMVTGARDFDERTAESVWEWLYGEVIPDLRTRAEGNSPGGSPSMFGKAHEKLKACKKQIETLTKENETLRVKCESMEMKAACFDALVKDMTLITLDETAEQIGIDPEAFSNRLLDLGYLHTDETGYLSICDEKNDGLFVETRKARAKTRSCCDHFSITPKGFATFWLLFHGRDSQQ